MIQTETEKAAEERMAGYAIAHPGRLDEIHLQSWHFANQLWGRVWETVALMRQAGEPVEPLTVANRLEQERTADREATANGSLLAKLSMADMEAAVFPEKYAAIVRDSWVTRQVLFACSETIAARETGIDAQDLLSLALEKLAGIAVEQPSEAISIGQLVKQRFLQLSEIATAKAKGKPMATGVQTGIQSLDKLLGGLQRGICTVVAARPGMGKSAFTMAVSDHVSRMGVGVHVFSLEDTREAYSDRTISRESEVGAEKLRACDLTDRDLKLVGDAASRLYHRQRWIVDDRSGISAEEIVRSVRRELKRNQTQLVVVDYVQLLKAPHGTPRQQAHDKTWVTDHAMNVLADAAKQDGIAYVVNSQLNRECEKREDKRPLLSDLKQSGAIEERAKTVLMLYRPAAYDETANENEIEILVRKNNNGQMGYVKASWHGPTTRIY